MILSSDKIQNKFTIYLMLPHYWKHIYSLYLYKFILKTTENRANFPLELYIFHRCRVSIRILFIILLMSCLVIFLIFSHFRIRILISHHILKSTFALIWSFLLSVHFSQTSFCFILFKKIVTFENFFNMSYILLKYRFNKANIIAV